MHESKGFDEVLGGVALDAFTISAKERKTDVGKVSRQETEPAPGSRCVCHAVFEQLLRLPTSIRDLV